MSFTYEVLDLGLVYYKNIIPDPQNIIDAVNKIDERYSKNENSGHHTDVRAWSPWTYGDLHFNDQKFFPPPEQISPQDYYYKEMFEVTTVMYRALDEGFKHYTTKIYPFAENNIKTREESINLLRYGKTGHLPAHQDQGVSSRVLSTVMYLNDNYEGGEIEFINSGVKIKPEAGSIIFFPSNFLYIHEVHPITSGLRYSMPHWYHNMKNMIHSNGDE
jgi:Rps23 Pro-64 3,4-dihydroxylase Tpa1-like proline 4-hydroxylase